MKKKIFESILVVVFLSVLLTQNFYAQNGKTAKTKSNIFDTGKMWTFDYPPVEYLTKTYNFTPTEDWLEDVRLSALRMNIGCSASFVSENGLMMTNNHCAVFSRKSVQKEGENLERDGFYAQTLEEERKVPDMYVEQLLFFTDVTEEIQTAMDSGKTAEEKVKLKTKKINELIQQYNEETGLNCQFVSFFNGGKFSIYGYKRYTDVRLVFEPEQSIASFGGDLDNFTYPRYDLDCTFFRVYDDEGKPVNSEHYFKFSSNGVQKGEVIFSVGNPGRTNRLKTVAQLEYYRDVSYRNRAFLFDQLYYLLDKLKKDYPERADEFERIRTRIGNGQKVFHYTLQGLNNPNLIARKKDFEDKIITKVKANPELNNEYGTIWTSIAALRKEMKPYEEKLSAYRISRLFSPKYFTIAKKMITFAEQMKLPEEERNPLYQGVDLDSLRNTIYPDSLDEVLNLAKLQIQLDYIRLNLGDENEFVQKLCGNLHGKEAAEHLLKTSLLGSKQKADALLKGNPDDLLNSEDPIIYFVKNTKDKIGELAKKIKDITDTESVLENQLGKVLFEIYGTEIPPDANFTLRLSDGLLQTVPYNGTEAVPKTTFYGMYNRYYGSDKTYPWNLPERWAKPPAGFDLSTTFNFISTNDIVGGNSGSAVINKNAEVVGLAFDGNVKSIVGNFIYLPEENRMVSVASQAILESLEKVYKAKRIYEELKTGKMVK